jgi:hypothetical protein
VLNNDGILDRLSECQQGLDSVGSIQILDLYERLKLKYDDLEDTINQYVLNNHVDLKDLVGTHVHHEIPGMDDEKFVITEDQYELDLLAKFMIAATLKDCSIVMTFSSNETFSIQLIDLDPKLTHRLRYMCELHKEIQSIFKESGLKRSCYSLSHSLDAVEKPCM